MVYRRKQNFRNKETTHKPVYLKKNHTTKSPSQMDMKDLINQDLQGLIDRNTSLAQEAVGLGDRVLAEYHYQHAEYFMRLLNGGIGH